MGFITENREIKDIFHGRRIFEIPRYQREYVWDKKNWNDLKKDIEFLIKNEDNEWSHFLGTIVMHSKSENEGIKIFELVDGQQRLTTLYISLLAIYDKFFNSSEEKFKKRAIAMREYIFSTNELGEVKLKIDNTLYNETFSVILESVEDKQVLAFEKNKKIYDTFKYFKSIFEQLSDDEVLKYYNQMLNVKIVEIISDSNEEIYNIFEVLNARGQQLKQIELLKNHIFKYISPKTHLDTAKMKFDKIITNGSFTTDIDKLIYHFNKCYFQNDILQKDSYYYIKENVDIEEINNFLDSLLEFSNAYQKISDKNTENLLYQYFIKTRNEQIRPILVALELKASILEEKNVEKVLTNLRNFYFVYNTVGETANSTTKIIKKYSYKMYKANEKNELKTVIRDFFTELISQYKDSMTLQNFSNNILNGKYSYSTKVNKYKRTGYMIKYIFTEYHNYYCTDIKIDNTTLNKLTIEHLKGDVAYIDKEFHSLLKLTIIDSKTNSNTLSNKELYDKLIILSSRSSLYYNKELMNYFDTTTKEMDWNCLEKNFINMLYKNVFKYHAEVI